MGEHQQRTSALSLPFLLQKLQQIYGNTNSSESEEMQEKSRISRILRSGLLFSKKIGSSRSDLHFKIATKIMRPHFFINEELLKRFSREVADALDLESAEIIELLENFLSMHGGKTALLPTGSRLDLVALTPAIKSPPKETRRPQGLGDNWVEMFGPTGFNFESGIIFANR